MTNAWDFELNDYRDVAVLQKYREQVLDGDVAPEDYLTGLRNLNRDNARTPMQWNGQPGAGFSRALPWIPLNRNSTFINVADQISRPDSILQFYQTMIRLRKVNPTLIYGSFTEYLGEHEQIYLYTRQAGPDTREYLILLNLTSAPAEALLPGALVKRLEENSLKLLLSNAGPTADFTALLSLRPWEARLYEIIPANEMVNNC